MGCGVAGDMNPKKLFRDVTALEVTYAMSESYDPAAAAARRLAARTQP